MKRTGAQIVLESLIEQGTDVVFGYPGGTVINIYDAFWEYKDRMRHILTAHEQGAAHAADGYARATGKVGVCVATSGPGATNLVTGIATAYLDSIPMVAITANVPLDLLGRDTFQEVDITGLTVPITKHNFFVRDVNELAATIRKAFEVAVSGRQGPVLIDIPKDITSTVIDYIPAGHYQKRPTPVLDPVLLAEAKELIEQAERPVIYFGGGIIASEAEKELQEFSTRAHCPVIASTRGLSAIPYDFPLYLGMIGMHGTPTSNYAVSHADLLIAVGTRFSERVTGDKSQFATHAKILQIDIDSSELGKNLPVDCEIVGDAKEALQALLALLAPQSHEEWSREILTHRAHNPMPSGLNQWGIDVRKVLSEVKQVGGEDTIVVTDVGQHQMITAQHYNFSVPRTFLSSLGLGTMGYGMGAAVGAKIGMPDRNVVLITGDGCFHMNMNELAVAVTEELPLVVIVMNNQVLGMVRQWQKLFYQSKYSATTPNRKTNYVKLAEAMGAIGLRIESNEDIPGVIATAFAAKGPVLIECPWDVEESVFPIIPPGGSEKDMIYAD